MSGELQEERRPLAAWGLRCSVRAVSDGTDVYIVYQPEGKGLAPRLVFESARGMVDVHQFPADWHTLADADLLALRPE